MDRFKLSILIIGFVISVLFSIQAMTNVESRSLRDININLLQAVRKELSSSVPHEMRFNLHYKCWAYRAEYNIETSVGLNEAEISKFAIQTLQAFSRVFERSIVNKELYYDPSDLYLYEGTLYDKNSKLHVFIRNGRFELIKEKNYLTPEEKEKYKDQLINPLHRSEHYILIWKKTLQEMLLYLSIDCPEVTCNSESVLNFSEDPAIRDAIIKVRTRILDVLEKDGYEEFISVPFKGLALDNKQGPYHWMFFLDKAFPKIKNNKEIPVPYDPEAYIEEYKRLHHLILTMINEAPELKPYLQRPVAPRDLELNYMCSQQVWKGEKFIEAYDHLIYRTHSHLMMNWQKCSVSHVLKRKGMEVPLEEFFQKMGV